MNTQKVQCVLKVIYIFWLFAGCDAMTRQQLKNSGKLMKKSCMPKNFVTEDDVGQIEQGKFLENRNVMCYIACIYTMTQVVSMAGGSCLPSGDPSASLLPYTVKEKHTVVPIPKPKSPIPLIRNYFIVKNNKLSYDAVIKQVDVMFPAEMRDSVKVAATHCKDVAKKYKDLCEASYWTAKCMYDFDAANFVFP